MFLTEHYQRVTLLGGAGPFTEVPTVTFAQDHIEIFGRDHIYIREGNSALVRVLINAAPTQPLTIPITVQPDSTGLTADDYSGVPMSVTFAPGQREQSFTVAALLDQEIEGTEYFTLQFDTLPSGVAVGDENDISVSLSDNSAGGVLTVTGGQTPEVGQVLTAVPTGVVSDHGLTQAVYEYQWYRQIRSLYYDMQVVYVSHVIDGATDATYTPTLADAGIRLKVRVSFTDDAGNANTIDSATTAPVADNSDDVLLGNWTAAIGGRYDRAGSHGDISFGYEFGTGDHPSGYYLTSVNLMANNWSNTTSFSIWSAGTSEYGPIPDVSLISLVMPQRPVRGPSR